MKTKKYVLFITVVFSSVSSIASEVSKPKEKKKVSEKVKRLEALIDDLDKKYKPSKDTCRPSIRAKGEGFEEVIGGLYSEAKTIDGELACLLKGYKPIIVTNIELLCKSDYFRELYKEGVLLAQWIDLTLRDEEEYGTEVVIYIKDVSNPKSLENAQLYKLMIYEGVKPTHYLRGYLLGHSDENIKAFYKFRTAAGDAVDFDADKEAALAWIEANKGKKAVYKAPKKEDKSAQEIKRLNDEITKQSDIIKSQEVLMKEMDVVGRAREKRIQQLENLVKGLKG